MYPKIKKNSVLVIAIGFVKKLAKGLVKRIVIEFVLRILSSLFAINDFDQEKIQSSIRIPDIKQITIHWKTPKISPVYLHGNFYQVYGILQTKKGENMKKRYKKTIFSPIKNNSYNLRNKK